MDERLIAEPHLGLRWVDVYIHRVCRHLDEQVHFRAPLFYGCDAVRIDDRVRDCAVLDDAAIDEEVLGTPRRPLLGERRDESGQSQTAGSFSDVDKIRTFAVQLIETVAQRCGRGALHHRPAAACEREADLRVGKRELRDDSRDLCRLSPVRLQKFATRRQVVEQIVDLNHRAFRGADFHRRRDGAPVYPDFSPALLPARACAQHEMRHGGD